MVLIFRMYIYLCVSASSGRVRASLPPLSLPPSLLSLAPFLPLSLSYAFPPPPPSLTTLLPSLPPSLLPPSPLLHFFPPSLPPSLPSPPPLPYYTSSLPPSLLPPLSLTTLLPSLPSPSPLPYYCRFPFASNRPVPDSGSIQWNPPDGAGIREVQSTVRSRNPAPDDSKRMEIDSTLLPSLPPSLPSSPLSLTIYSFLPFLSLTHTRLGKWSSVLQAHFTVCCNVLVVDIKSIIMVLIKQCSLISS